MICSKFLIIFIINSFRNGQVIAKDKSAYNILAKHNATLPAGDKFVK
jgi:hypothetical protein